VAKTFRSGIQPGRRWGKREFPKRCKKNGTTGHVSFASKKGKKRDISGAKMEITKTEYKEKGKKNSLRSQRSKKNRVCELHTPSDTLRFVKKKAECKDAADIRNYPKRHVRQEKSRQGARSSGVKEPILFLDARQPWDGNIKNPNKHAGKKSQQRELWTHTEERTESELKSSGKKGRTKLIR